LISDELEDFVTVWAVPLFAAATISLWFLDRPGPWYRWKVAALAGMTAAGVGLLISQVITSLWARERPYVAHPGETLLLTPPSHEPSFPSDHAVAAFAIAFVVAFIGKRMGALFLAGASFVALTRVFVGLHYPGDIAGGVLIAFVAALLVRYTAQHRYPPIIRFLSKFTDPLVRPGWEALDRAKARRRRSA
jgi:undecaprenyl-diphosphatase